MALLPSSKIVCEVEAKVVREMDEGQYYGIHDRLSGMGREDSM